MPMENDFIKVQKGKEAYHLFKLKINIPLYNLSLTNAK